MTTLGIIIAALTMLVLYAGWRVAKIGTAESLDETKDLPEQQTIVDAATTAPESIYGRVVLTRPDDDGIVGVWTWNPPQSPSEPYPPGETFTFTHDPEAPNDPTAGIIRLGAVPYEPPPKQLVRRVPPTLRRRLRR